jgi:threonine-phosphate decarboxylase
MAPFSVYEHGGEIYALARRLRTTPDKLLDFSSNANIFAYGLTESLVRKRPYPFIHYPDTRAAALIDAIAAHEETDVDRILPGNGASELIWLALRALDPRRILFIGPVFSEYIIACRVHDIAYDILTPPAENDFVPTNEDLQKLWETDADLVILCTPNNPAAAVYDNIPNMLQMLRAPRALVDLSYREFLFGRDDYALNTMASYQSALRPGVSLFTLHSFTKFFCCPGIRLGYLVGDRTQLARMAALRPSWTISPFAQMMGLDFLAAIDQYRETLPPLNAAVAEMGRELRRMDCMSPERVFEGPGFLCCGLAPRFSAPGVARALLKRRFIVRNCDTIPGMPPGYIRLQARPWADAERLLSVLEALTLDTL